MFELPVAQVTIKLRILITLEFDVFIYGSDVFVSFLADFAAEPSEIIGFVLHLVVNTA